MACEVIAPKSGIYDGDVRVVSWLVSEGERVVGGRALFEMETEKLVMEVEAEAPGWLHIVVAAGSDVPIGSVVGLLAETEAEYLSLSSEGQ